MTNREEEVLNLIKSNPLISQNELSDILKITRSSVGVHIGNLIKKGYISGRGYVMNKEKFVSIIGGTNIDIVGFSNSELRLGDSNPGNIKFSLGGVGRNIGENLARLEVETKLISVIGNDIYGRKVIDEGREIGLDLDQSLKLDGESTSIYMSVLDNSGDMKIAISSMDIYEKMSIDFIKGRRNIIESSRICVIDTNIPKDVIEYVVNNFKNTKFFLDTVSSTKATKVKDIIHKFHTIKPNKIEAEILSGMEIKNMKDVEKVSEYFLNLGVENVFISLGEEGVYYNNGKKRGLFTTPKINVVNANGAGDAFVAGLVYSSMNDYNIQQTLEFATTCSALAISHKDTINPNISLENINKKMKENKLC
ncbi:MAG: PfkB family carbohydrate kinase [Clostridium sp.]|uniref:PfkB family carbohydrate kinase n=1 Tax=Clostridium sp. TaxID=1506 RepID=UPI003065DD43